MAQVVGRFGPGFLAAFTVEDRAHQEVDRARHELKALRAQLATLGKERVAVEQRLRQERDAAQKEASKAQREASVERTRADSLDRQLAKWGDLSKLLRQAAPAASSTKSRPSRRKS